MNILQIIFSIKNSNDRKHKIITILGIKLKLKRIINKENGMDEVKVYSPFQISETVIGKGTYIAQNSKISMTTIGKYCSIGPNLVCGFGIHPTTGISTSPCFYSTLKQNGMTFSDTDKIEERKPIKIGNDVFIGMNVSILDGVTIGDGAIVGAGAVVVKDVEPYSIVGGVPAKHIRYRFEKDVCEKLQKIKWWDWNDDKLKDVERMFFDVNGFVEKYNGSN
jgi:acetyltransferase-like isoleucine patch superfamily enzyme